MQLSKKSFWLQEPSPLLAGIYLLTCPGWDRSGGLRSHLELSEIDSDFTQGPSEISGAGRAFLLRGWGWGVHAYHRVPGLLPARGAATLGDRSTPFP